MIEFYNLTFAELKTKPNIEFKDPYNIASTLNSEMKKAILVNPSGYREDEVCQILALDGDVVVGCTNPYSGRVRLNGEVYPAQNGSTLFSHEDYREENVGGELFYRISTLHPSRNCFFCGISQMAIGLYRVLKFNVFEFPRLIYLRKSRSVIQSILKTESPIIKLLIICADVCLWLHRTALSMFVKLTKGGYKVCKQVAVPQEVIDIMMEDEHPFAEYHDKAWMEWNLNYSVAPEPRKKTLFTIEKDGKIEAFFLTKVQFFETASSRGFKNVNLGTVMEWGISKASKLTEKDINLLAIQSFDKDVDGIQVATTDENLARKLKRYLFVGIGKANFGVKIKSVKDPGLKDINNWRVRLAGCDTLMN